MEFTLNYYNLSLLLGGFIALLSGFIVYFNDPRGKENITWLLLNISTATWSFGYALMISATDKSIAWISNFVLHYAAIFIPLLYLFFIFALTGFYDVYKRKLLLTFLFPLIFLFANPSGLFVTDVYPKFIFNYVPDAGPLYIYFTAYFFIFVIYALIVLSKKIPQVDEPEGSRLRYVLFSSIAGFVGGGSVFFLTFNINIPPYPIVLFSLYPIIITYAILRHHLFDIKVLSTELFSALLVFILFLRFILSENQQEFSLNGFILLAVGIVSVYLIKSVIKEVRDRGEIEKLNLQLQKSIEELQKLDELKTEFVSLASHQLRTPLTPIKGYSDMLRKGEVGGPLNEVQKDAVEKIYLSSLRMVELIKDLLDVSKLEKEGGFSYHFMIAHPEEMVESIVEEVRSEAEKEGSNLSFQSTLSPEVKVKFDKVKLKDAIENVIINAIKYTPKGNIWVTMSGEGEWVVISVKDTGVGINKEDIPRLFQKFFRGKEVVRLSTEGSGLGLYFSKHVVEDHKGQIWVHSEGVGKGSEFIIKLPKV